MTTSIGGVTLDNDLIWKNRHSYKDLTAVAYSAIDGTEIVMEAARGRHFPITLEATEKTGWLKGGVVKSLRELSSVKGAIYTLDINGEEYEVRFRNEVNGGAIQMKLVIKTTAPDDNTYYFGKLHLMSVG